MKVAVIDYNAGNTHSVMSALKRIGVEANLTKDLEYISAADKVIFPGVGEASTTMRFLKELKLDSCIKALKQPVLGICLGMQLMCEHSEENDTETLGIFDVPVKRFISKAQEDKVPHMGWNQIEKTNGRLFSESIENEYLYFVHSFYVPKNKYTIAETNYLLRFSAAINKNNFYATQFHPEKSGKIGRKILENFISL